MTIKNIAIIGGSGFVGSVIANRLSSQGLALNILTRRRDSARRLWPLPNTTIKEVNAFDAKQLRHAIKDADAVINLVGILNEKKDDGLGFRRAHVELTQEILNACKAESVKRYLHMSALNADSFAPSYYLRTKGEAENVVLGAGDNGLAVTIFRPSVIFGRNDGLFNRFKQLLKISPILPLACSNTKFQPVYVGDVASAFIRCLSDNTTIGRKYDLGGPEVLSLRDIVEYTNALCEYRRIIVPLGAKISKIQAQIFERIPGKPFSLDNLRSASEDSVVLHDNGLEELGITPSSFRGIVPTYLHGDLQAQYDVLRSESGR